jgi:hypothetical protein
MPVIPINRVVVKKRMVGKNGGPKRRRATRGRWPPKTTKLINIHSNHKRS